MPSPFDHIQGADHSDIHNRKGIVLANRGWLDEAKNEFEQALKLNPESSEVHDNLGTINAEKGNLFEALNHYLHAINLEPDSPTAHFNLGCFLSTHAHELSTQEFEQACEIDDTFSDSFVNLGLSFFESDNLLEAAEAFTQALAHEPDDQDARLELANTYIALGDHRKAIVQLKKLILQNPDHMIAQVALSNCYAAHGLFNLAEEVLLSCLKRTPKDVSLVFALACLKERTGSIPRGLQLLRKSLKLNSDYVKRQLKDKHHFQSIRLQDGFKTLLKDY